MKGHPMRAAIRLWFGAQLLLLAFGPAVCPLLCAAERDHEALVQSHPMTHHCATPADTGATVTATSKASSCVCRGLAPPAFEVLDSAGSQLGRLAPASVALGAAVPVCQLLPVWAQHPEPYPPSLALRIVRTVVLLV